MNCKKCHKELVSYLEHTLAPGRAAEVEKHLSTCEGCRAFTASLEESLASLSESRFTEPDPFFYTRVKARLEREIQKQETPTGWAGILRPAFLYLFLLAALFAGIGIGTYDWSGDRERYLTESLDPWLNELEAEPLESFLMD